MISPSFKPGRLRTRWFCYLDLLGFRAMVASKAIDRVIPVYQEIVGNLRAEAKKWKSRGVIHSWFSDTFIIYTKDDSEKEFAYLEHISRLFFQKLVLQGIPLRGAITHGQLYSQSKENIFVGPALIDAYCYGEGQSWIGFILTPAVHARLDGTDLALKHRAHYRLVTEPGVIRHEPSSPVYAFAFNNGLVNGRNPYVGALEKMKAVAPDGVKAKYEQTLRFIRTHKKE